ncbi:protein-disulfide reductase DsbD family protein [Novosphingobium kunmingense]|uniref:protein-disulfide reductase DsbD family protein n=1 Tax=Novosphingobium kunmingense TaxID=1211806 RepID=UPI001E2FDE8C|nr:thioredoxin family protein [Novosphingobium kunmingense]
MTPAAAQTTHIVPELVAESAGQPGKTVTLAIVMRPEAGWHGYWLNPGDAGLGMTVDWGLPAGARVGPLRYPVPDTLLIAGLMNHVFEHEYALLVDVAVPADARPGAVLPVRGKAQWLACTDKICVPESGVIATQIAVGVPGSPDPRFAAWRAALPAPLGSAVAYAFAGDRVRIAVPLPATVALDDPHLFVASERTVDYASDQDFSRRGDMLIVELPRAKFEPLDPGTLNAVLRLNRQGDGVEIAATPGTVPPAGTPLRSAAPPQAGLGWLLLSALLGGLLLNIMPCVFPILSLKALSLARAGESVVQARAEGLAYTAGVVLACLALGVLLLALRAAGTQVGWAFQLQEPAVVAGLLLLAVAITANLAGLFEFAVPGFAREGSPQGAFATGLLAAFVATPCTGPFMAAAMGAALLMPAMPALALFAALGLGLALPFLALAFVPAMRRRLPRPGAWMGRFKLALAVPMGLTALALLWLESRVAGMRFAVLSLLFVGAVVLGLYLVGRGQRVGRSGAVPALGTLAAAAMALLVLPATATTPGAAAQGVLPSKPFSEAALAEARSAGKPVFAYFTADWCLTCKVNESAAIERKDTRDAFARAGVVVLRGDWTRRDPAITRYLTEHGAAGVPLYMWYPAKGGAAQQLPQVLTPATLADLVR